MIQNENQLLQYLAERHISYERVEHPPVYTCQQADVLRPELRGASTKNLFLQEGKNGACYLLMTACSKRLDLKSLKTVLGAEAKLHFASADLLLEHLGVTPGAVTLLALVNDEHKQIELYIDALIWREEYFLCHPLVNTATLVLDRENILQFLEICGHQPRIIDVPGEMEI